MPIRPAYNPDQFRGTYADPSALSAALPNSAVGDYAYVISTGTQWYWDLNTTAWKEWAGGGGGGGDVFGPTGATDDAVARFDTVSGKLIQDSLVLINDAGSISLPALQTVDGRDVSVDGTKLDTIEPNAKDDQNAAEVPVDTTNFDKNLSAADNTVQKALETIDEFVLGGGGSGDVVGPAGATDEAVARYDTATGKLLQNSLVIISDAGNIILPVLATVDGRDVSIDGAKLDTIEVGATADQSAAEVPTNVGSFDKYLSVSDDTVQKALDTLDDIPVIPNTDFDWNGFFNRTDSTISFVDGTRTFTISPAVTSYEYYVEGIKYSKTSPDSIIITDVEGIHIIYFDGATLTETVLPTVSQIDTIIRTKALVSIIYWSVSAAEATYVGEERHGKSMSPVHHSYHHFINGLRYISPGLGLNSILSEQSGDLDTHAQFGVDAGAVSDEDLFFALAEVISTTGLPIWYMTGSTPEWNKYINSGFAVRTFDGTSATRLAFNELVGGVWQLTEVNANDFVLCHVFASTDTLTPIFSIMGQNEYSTLGQARVGAELEILSLIINNILIPETRPIATLVFQTSNGYTNAVKGRIRQIENGIDYIDWRISSISRTTVSTSDHNALANLQGGTPGEYYHLTQARHDGLVIGPASAVTDNYLARFDGTTGKIIQQGLALLDDAGQLTISTINIINNLLVGGNVDGRDVSVDGAKLDGIEAGANAPPFVTTDYNDDSVTYAKIQNVVGNNVLLGNNSGAGSIVEELTQDQSRDLLREAWTALTFSSSITPNALAASRFELVITGDCTLNVPTNLSEGQVIIYRIRQNATGGFAVTFHADYRTGQIPNIEVSQGAAKTTYVICIYHEGDTKMDMVSFMKEY